MRRLALAASVVLLLLAGTVRAGDRPLWLAIGPREAREHVERIARHRAAGGLDTRFVAFEDLPGETPLPDRVRTAVREATPAFLLLVGDGAGDGWVLPPLAIEARRDRRSYTGKRIHTDLPYGDLDGDGLPDVAVGRFPARDAAELSVLVDKTIAYERDLPGGVWQKQAAFVTGEGHYGPVVDGLLERLFATVVRDTVPPGYDVDVTYANPTSSYFRPPSEFAGFVRDRLARGSLLFTYVGHGMADRVDDIRSGGESYRVMDVETAKGLAIAHGSPVVGILACWTGLFSFAEKEGIGEVLVRAKGGPVAFFGATFVSTNHGNAILGYELARHMLDAGIPTLGVALDRAKHALVTGDPTPTRRLIDVAARVTIEEGDTWRADALRHAAMYVLLGDPALRLRRPESTLELALPEKTPRGAKLVVRGAAPAGVETVEITLETERTSLPRDMPPALPSGGDGYAERVRERHRRSNDKVLLRASAPVRDGAFSATFDVPADLEIGMYVVKAHAIGPRGLVIGARSVKVGPAAGGGWR